MTEAGRVFGTLGALSAFPLRLAKREVQSRGGRISRGFSRRTTDIVVGRTLLSRIDQADIEQRIGAARAPHRRLVGEGRFLRDLGLAPTPEHASLSRQSLLDQSRINPHAFDMLALFDGFEHDREPYSFRDIILAKKYAGLLAGGASWLAVARSIHRLGPAASLTAKSLHAGGSDAIFLRHADGLTELDGQLLFNLATEDPEVEEVFAAAEAAEAEGLHAEAAALYGRCLAIDPDDAVAAFNRANCLHALGNEVEAAHDFMRAVKLDPDFAEAWFNLAGLMVERGRTDTARRHFNRAIAADKTYSDPVFNLARMEFDAGRLEEARRLWSRYLELDPNSDWATTAARGIRLIDLQTQQKAG